METVNQYLKEWEDKILETLVKNRNHRVLPIKV